MHDIVIRNGDIIDGTGLPRYRADLGIQNGRIAEIGRIRERGKQEIDAEGHAVTPGFIDGHTHMDAQVFWDSLGTCSCWHGVTSVVMGNCGFTLAPATKAQRPLVVRNLERAEDISGAAMEAGIEWQWSSFREYMDVVDRLPKGINYAANIGHSALRTYVMGEKAFESAASDGELRAMGAELRDALDAGAVGFSTSRSNLHRTADDRPVASRLASWDEVRYLSRILGETGKGMLEMALEPVVRSENHAERDRVIREVEALVLESGAPFTFGVQPGRGANELLAMVDRTAHAGGRIFAQTHSRGVSVLMSFRTAIPFDHLAEWKPLRAEPLESQKQLLRDPEVRRRLVEAAHKGPYVNGESGAEAPRPDYNRMMVLERAVPPNPTVAAMAAQRGMDPVELMIDLALKSDMQQMFMQLLDGATHDNLLSAMRHPRTVMTFSDSGAHVSMIMDSSIQTHLLAYWVRDQQAFTLEEAVRMITLAPAVGWNFTDRGMLRPGCIADINVFDPARIAPDVPRLVYDLPTGARRLTQKTTGIRATLVAGEVVLRDGEHTGALPGQLVRFNQ